MGSGSGTHPTSTPWSRRLFARQRKIKNRLFLNSVLLGRHDLLAAVEAVRADVVTAMNLAGAGFNGGGRVGQEVMSTVIAALAGGFLILLNSHFLNTPRGLKVNF